MTHIYIEIMENRKYYKIYYEKFNDIRILAADRFLMVVPHKIKIKFPILFKLEFFKNDILSIR